MELPERAGPMLKAGKAAALAPRPGILMSDQDWRLQGQDEYLTGVTLARRQWRQTRPDWDHDHCAFCWAKFGDEASDDRVHEGWTTTPDEYHWICDVCFGDFNERFGWRIETAAN